MLPPMTMVNMRMVGILAVTFSSPTRSIVSWSISAVDHHVNEIDRGKEHHLPGAPTRWCYDNHWLLATGTVAGFAAPDASSCLPSGAAKPADDSCGHQSQRSSIHLG